MKLSKIQTSRDQDGVDVDLYVPLTEFALTTHQRKCQVQWYEQQNPAGRVTNGPRGTRIPITERDPYENRRPNGQRNTPQKQTTKQPSSNSWLHVPMPPAFTYTVG